MRFTVTQCSRQPPSIAVLTLDDRSWVSGLGDDWGDGRVNSEECREGKTRTRTQRPSPPAALGWAYLSMSPRPVSSFARLVFPLTTSLLFSFSSFLLSKAEVPNELGVSDDDGNVVWFVITLPQVHGS